MDKEKVRGAISQIGESSKPTRQRPDDHLDYGQLIAAARKHESDLDVLASKLSHMDRFRGTSSVVDAVIPKWERDFQALIAKPDENPNLKEGLRLLKEQREKEKGEGQEDHKRRPLPGDEYLKGGWRIWSDDRTRNIEVLGGLGVKAAFAINQGLDDGRLHNLSTLAIYLFGEDNPGNRRKTMTQIRAADSIYSEIGYSIQPTRAKGQLTGFRVEPVRETKPSLEQAGISIPGFGALQRILANFKTDMGEVMAEIEKALPPDTQITEATALAMLTDTLSVLRLGRAQKILNQDQLTAWESLQARTGKITIPSTFDAAKEFLHIWYQAQKVRGRKTAEPIPVTEVSAPAPRARVAEQRRSPANEEQATDRLTRALEGKLRYLAKRGISSDVSVRTLNEQTGIELEEIIEASREGVLQLSREHGLPQGPKDRIVSLRSIAQWLYLRDKQSNNKTKKASRLETSLIDAAFERALSMLPKQQPTPEAAVNTEKAKEDLLPVGDVILRTDGGVAGFTTWDDSRIGLFIHRQLSRVDRANPRIVNAIRAMVDYARQNPKSPDTHVKDSTLRSVRPQLISGVPLNRQEAGETRVVYRVYKHNSQILIRLEGVFRSHQEYEKFLKNG